ncbi:cytochrome b5 isoform X1 [Sitophilus oryzae]|uniref:Cytochrome b5 n=1 Tax=Sitophilus oryzae TaxID=7048 RepID=A0A6J2YS63_SITOR|nr:cytochrome b5 isoform X1 [Sitophilus oryzae]
MVQEYTKAQVRDHNKKESVWVLVHNDIYDVTAFLNEHPGGEEVLLEQAGKDASEAFEDVGHSSDAREMMLKYKVGTLVASERKPEQPKKSTVDWKETSESSESSLKSWIIPVALGLAATIIYRLYFMS